MRRLLSALLLIASAAVLTAALFYGEVNTTSTQMTAETFVKIGEHSVEVAVADTAALRMRGLSGRASLADNEGMLFVFEENVTPVFWMKDMRFSIDILWIERDGRVVGVEESVSPESYPQKFFPPLPVRYVLEVPAGWTQRNNISVGDLVTLPVL